MAYVTKEYIMSEMERYKDAKIQILKHIKITAVEKLKFAKSGMK